jgi:hypothetical protein
VTNYNSVKFSYATFTILCDTRILQFGLHIV